MDIASRRRGGIGSRSKFKDFQQAVKKATDSKFVLGRVVACGSDANMYAVFEASGSNPDSCLVACGSYVSGDDGLLASWTTSGQDSFQLSTNIADPSEVANIDTRRRTVALPYLIDSNKTNSSDIIQYELDCARELHRRCLLAKMEGREVKCILLELILCGNGGELSDRFLDHLAAIATLHRFSVVVDECITGGRVGPTMLLTQSKPLSFQACVSHVTMSKWMGVGIVLRSKDTETKREKPPFPRGMTTQLCTDDALFCWNAAVKRLPFIGGRRKTVLSAMKIDDKATWGGGLLIFANKHRRDTCMRGFKNRLLPMNEDLAIDSIGFTQAKVGYTKKEIDARIRQRVVSWLKFSELEGNQVDRSLLLLIEDGGVDNESVFDAVEKLIEMTQVDKCEARASWKRALSCRLISVKMKSKRRVLRASSDPICTLNL